MQQATTWLFLNSVLLMDGAPALRRIGAGSGVAGRTRAAHRCRLPRRRLRRHLIWIGSLSVVVSIVERLVPDELWELFQR
ncbi:hypothetical protein, partial [Streptomyces sp. NPDC050564]|uniref:hypothetical protein n=1 Tax=Streptomyces sp. NPDC050564 TaxID=3365631 RepID=UPI0037B9592F